MARRGIGGSDPLAGQLFAQVPGPRPVRGPEGAVLEGEEKRVFFFGQAKAKPIKWKRLIGRALLSKTGRTIISLAQQHGVSYTPTANDTWARDVTRLAGDDVVLDDIELLLIALQRTGHLSRPEALRLQVDYLREARL